MTQQIPPPPPPKKLVSRNVAFALGIICIVLVVGLVGAFAYYASQISSLNSQVSSLNSEVGSLIGIVDLGNFTVWVNDATVTQAANYYTSWSFSAGYSGYISVNVQSSTTNNTYARVIYSAYGVDGGVNYDNTITVGTNGTAFFPVVVLPSIPPITYMGPAIRPGSFPSTLYPVGTTFIEVRVGNTNTVGNAAETVTITYYY